MLSPEFSFSNREKILREMTSSALDLLVIGGGITGAAVARDAALRGLRVGLIEADDFASGTSSGSTKLLHGGLRYLEQFEFKLVAEAIHERELLRKMYGPLSEDLSFVFPTYSDMPPPRWQLNLGLWLYDSFSFFRVRHLNLSRERCLQKFPYLKSEKLTGAGVYTDSFSPDFRLVIEVIKSAVRAGALCVSQMKAEEFQPSNTPIQITALDRLNSNRKYEIRAKFVFNCCGPFSDSVRTLLQLPPALKLTQGVHIIVKKEKLPIETAFVFADPKLRRILFSIPWNSITYLGTTDTSVEKVSDAKTHPQDIDYILSVFSHYFRTPLTASDVIQNWVAVRPLLAPADSRPNSQISREHRIEEAPENFFHILGGKLTSHRLMAEEAVDLLSSRISIPKSRTHKVPLQDQFWSKSKSPDRLDRVFGNFAADILEMDRIRNLNQKRIWDQAPHLVSEALYSIHNEMALRPFDFYRRRSTLYYEYPSEKVLENLSQIFSSEIK